MNKEPCDNCLVLPLCLRKSVYDTVDHCLLLRNHLRQSFKNNKFESFHCHVEALNRSFSYTVILVFNLEDEDWRFKYESMS